MIEKLELKHILPYLQYNLRYVAKKESDILNDTWADESLDNSTTFDQALSANNKQAIELLNSPITIELYLAHEGKDLHLGSGENSLGYPIDDIFTSEVKPLLRPMSDLFENIVHNGEIICVAKVIKNLDDSIEWWNESRTALHYPETGEFCITSSDKLDYKWLDYSIVETLFKYHFDVFGLIEKGLAEPIVNDKTKA